MAIFEKTATKNTLGESKNIFSGYSKRLFF